MHNPAKRPKEVKTKMATRLERTREEARELKEKTWLTLSYDRTSSMKSSGGSPQRRAQEIILTNPPALKVNQNLILLEKICR